MRYVLTEGRKDLKLVLKSLPEDMAGWVPYRFSLKQKIRKCGVRPAVAARFLREMEQLSQEELKAKMATLPDDELDQSTHQN